MKIEVRQSNVPISQALDAHIVRKLDFAVRRFAPRLDTIVVRLVDLNGPRGGLDKRCRITASLRSPHVRVVAEATDADAYAAVSQAAAKLEERIGRAITRRREIATL